ncbi:hypothetical protein ASPACDRAFT_25984 [Aspergillus aculeatus ATCC 16872]|uniref:DNA 3'-5' helicase n=1 Tax=Aspergillus aculeatus (strain ATCC 16872 / CBS 172.66 / WB 5094) TaxID=690307 RepID=A0A1L9WYK2_ASPA1|nr:uncharacterized protein ASPACDRAFT_25984 [Aspergillus aculeatus ATCC 16872]OJK01223.1 hypothetical protein ASPACDRAFT_25984 [Aspergillus aculeatus ATCC 16872]
MDCILSGLNSSQSTAVTSPASVLQVLAPPGSGKTKTLTARVAYLLAHHNYRPQDVICCTFTIKASREMRERLTKLIGEDLQKRLLLGTFHSICRRYLVIYGHLIGLKKGFGIADSGDSTSIIKKIIKRLRVSIEPGAARGRISRQKAQGVGPDEVAARIQTKNKTTEQWDFVQVYREYERHLAESNLLDYDDLLVRCADLLRQHPKCVSNIQAVLVDEFQDTNLIQYELMNLFASQNKRITIVGDPDQSIYGFRSAEIKNLARMQKLYRDTSVVLLENNYRSSGSILNSAQDVIEQDTYRPAKKLQPTHSVGTMPVLRKLVDAEAEARWIVLEIKRCIGTTGKLLNYSDFAVLLRTAALSRRIESAMGKNGIPYRMVGGSKFFDRVEIKLLLDYLRVISHPQNSEALTRVINTPSRRIGEETIKALTTGAEKANLPLWDYIKGVAQGHRSADCTLSKLTNQGLCTFVGIIESARKKLSNTTDSSSPRILLDHVIKKLNFREYLKTLHGSNEENRWANVEELLSQADDTSGSDGRNPETESLPVIEGLEQQQAHPGEEALSRFLANVALSSEVTLQEEGSEANVSNEKVTISTIHAAKGLEWPVVFVPAVYNGSIPHSRAEDSDEERRLLYVAMTRAQALLYLSQPLEQSQGGEMTKLSNFLPEEVVGNRFRLVGPVFSDDVVHGIADILHRPKPEEVAIQEAQSTLTSLFDDRWTQEGYEQVDPSLQYGDRKAMVEGPYSKRKRFDQPQTTETDTWLPTPSLGFSSARNYIAASNAVVEDPATAKPGAKRKAIGSGPGRRPDASQKTLSGFLGLPSSPATTTEVEVTAKTLSVSGQRGTLSVPPFQTRPTNAAAKGSIPKPYTMHRPQVQRRQPPRPALEPSHPNAYTWLAEPTDLSRMPKSIVQNSHETSIQPTSAGSMNTYSASTDQLSRPVSTFHTTTMAMVQNQPPTTMRRTLGIRRSNVDGWQARMQRESQGR